MRYLSLFMGAAMCVASLAQAKEPVPTLSSVQAIAVLDLLNHQSIDLQPGANGVCEEPETKTVLDADLVIHRCKPEGAFAVVEQNGQSTTVALDSLVYMTSKTFSSGIDLVEWYYSGHWQQEVGGIQLKSRFTIKVLTRSDEPGKRYGYYSIRDYDRVVQLEIPSIARR